MTYRLLCRTCHHAWDQPANPFTGAYDPLKHVACPACGSDDWALSEQDQRALDDDARDLNRIQREWSEYDRDPPGS